MSIPTTENELTDQQEPELLWRIAAGGLSELELTRARLAALRLMTSCVPPLDCRDVMAVLALCLEPGMRRAFLRRGQPLRDQSLASGACLAMVVSIGLLLEGSGTSETTTPVRWETLMPEAMEYFVLWLDEVDGLCARTERDPDFKLGEATEREQLLYSSWNLWRSSQFDGRALIGDMKAALSLCHQRVGGVGEIETVELPGLLRDAAGSLDGIAELMIVGNKAKLRLGKWQTRDKLKSRFKEQREWDERRQSLELTNAENDDENRLADKVAKAAINREADPLQALEANDELQRAKEVLRVLEPIIAVRLARSKRNSAQWHLLCNYRALLLGQTTAAAVAKAAGLSKANVCDTWSELKVELRRALSAG